MESKIDSSFSRQMINYSMVWEDPKLLLESLPKAEKLNILSIGSAGCNCFSLLLRPNTKVTAIDLSKPQTQLILLKKTAIKILSHTDYLHFFDYIKNDVDKIKLYKRLRTHLEDDTKTYWDYNQKTITDGIIHSGRLERYLKSFYEKAIKGLYSKDELDFLLKNKDLDKQREIIAKHQNDFQKIMATFFNRDSFSKQGRSEAQFKYVEEKLSVESLLIERTIEAFNHHLICENPYLYYIFNSQFIKELLPDHLTLNNYQLLKTKLNNLRVLNSEIESLSKKESDKFNFFNLSDIFEYVSEEHFNSLLKSLSEISAKEATMGYWCLFVDRKLTQNNNWKKLEKLSEKLSANDRVWFYKSYNVLEHM